MKRVGTLILCILTLVTLATAAEQAAPVGLSPEQIDAAANAYRPMTRAEAARAEQEQAARDQAIARAAEEVERAKAVERTSSALAGFFLMALAAGAYLLPGMVASGRGHHNKGAIWALTILAGWTVLGWFIAFIWSLTAVRAVANDPAPAAR